MPHLLFCYKHSAIKALRFLRRLVKQIFVVFVFRENVLTEQVDVTHHPNRVLENGFAILILFIFRFPVRQLAKTIYQDVILFSFVLMHCYDVFEFDIVNFGHNHVDCLRVFELYQLLLLTEKPNFMLRFVLDKDLVANYISQLKRVNQQSCLLCLFSSKFLFQPL